MYERLLEINRQHKFANYVCAVIDHEKAMPIIRSNTGFPRSEAEEERVAGLHAKAGPLLANSAGNFLRSLEIDLNNTDAMAYLMFVRRDKLDIADTNEDAVRDRAEADEWRRRLDEVMAAGGQWPVVPTIIFDLYSPATRLRM